LAWPQGDVDESVRLLAVVTLKNAVGATWRKTLASRGARARACLPACLLAAHSV
jgi:hypothetical protein